MMEQNNQNFSPVPEPEETIGEMRYYPVPVCHRPDTELPAKLSYIFLMRPRGDNTETADAMLYFYIARNLDIPLVSFTLSYRFSLRPIMMDDPQAPMYTFDYTDEELNAHEYIVCKINLPADFQMKGCSAYVSSAKAADGTEYTYTPEDFTYSDADIRQIETAEAVTVPSPAVKDEKPRKVHKNRKASGETNRRRRNIFRISAGCVGAAALIGVMTVGYFYLTYQRTMLTVDVLLSAGQYTQAETIAEEALSRNWFYQDRKEKSMQTLDQLCKEKRFNEACRIARNMPYASVMQKICETAAEDSMQNGAYETAYAYAYGAPEPFADRIARQAAEEVYDPATGEFCEAAYLTAQKNESPEVQDQLLSAVIASSSARNAYVTAMRAAEKLSDPAQKEAAASEIYGTAIRHYIQEAEYERAAAFIQAYDDVAEHADAALNHEMERALIDYFYQKKDDAASAFFLAGQFGLDAADIAVQPEDPVIRNHLADFYPLLSPEQKRAYHAESLAFDTMLLTLDRGRLKGCPKFTEALKGKPKVVSVVTGTHYTVCIHTDGTVTVIPDSTSGNPIVPLRTEAVKLMAATQNCRDVVSAAVGEHHIVYLHADGTVTASGDRSRGQCKVGGKEWTDIVAVAAGNFFTIGLRRDGTVVAAGSDLCGQCDVSEYCNVVDVRACDQTAVLLFADGTVHIQGERSMGLHTANALTDITRIRAEASTIVAEQADGRCVLCGEAADTGDTGSVSSWNHVQSFAVGRGAVACIRRDGTLSVSGSHQPRDPADPAK